MRLNDVRNGGKLLAYYKCHNIQENEISQVTLITAHSPEIFSKNLRECGLTDYVNSYGIGSSSS